MPLKDVTVEIRSQRDIITARQEAREMARRLGFKLADQTRLATAVSELTRNALQYGRGGVCIIEDASNATDIRICVVVRDQGPGIADIQKAMTYGYSTGKSLGAGLPAARNLMHEFSITSEPGNTEVRACMGRRR